MGKKGIGGSRPRLSDEEFLARFPDQAASVTELQSKYPEYVKKSIRRRCLCLYQQNRIHRVVAGGSTPRYSFFKPAIAPMGIPDISDYDLRQRNLCSIVEELVHQHRVEPCEIVPWVRRLMAVYVRDIAEAGVTAQEVRDTFSDPIIRTLLGSNADLGQEAVELLVKTSVFISGRRRWFLSLSPLIGYTANGTPFYKGTGLPPRWVQSDGMY